MFYTCLPIPQHWPLAFDTISRWVPWVGALIGTLLVAADFGLMTLGMPISVRSALVVALWIAITGGLHLDGAMDTADGLAVPDRTRRLSVMRDSHMGAFGGMAVVMLLMLKVLALTVVTGNGFSDRAFGLVAACVWARWGQQWAIARYPYLRKEGKGAFHKSALPSSRYTLPSLLLIGLFSSGIVELGWVSAQMTIQASVSGLALALLTSGYFARQLGGHTGDTYGAVVEWTEALLLCALTCRF